MPFAVIQKHTRLVAAVLFSLALGACKVQIDVPVVGGSISTLSGSYSCASGQVCTIDINDLFFDETFVAQPAAGFEFVGWNMKERGLCGGLVANTCRLFSSIAEGSPALMAILEDPNEVFYLEPVFRTTTGALWDVRDVKYGIEDSDRQWLNVSLAGTAEPSPVYIFAHSNGSTANNMSQGQLDAIASAGYATVSWESIPNVSSPEQLITVWADSFVVLDWLRANAALYNIDPDRIIIGGRSRGSGSSWPLMHSGDPAILGGYFYNGLPEGFWQAPTIWTPVVDVNPDSPPVYFAFGPDRDDNDTHNPVFADPAIARYQELGIGDRVSSTEGMWDLFLVNGQWTNDAEIMEYFPAFAASLEGNALPDLFDDFEGSNTQYPWSETGPWTMSGGTYNMASTSGNRFTSAGNPLWDTYTFSADMITTASGTPAGAWKVGSLAFRATDTQNFYRLRLNTDGSLRLFSVVNGVQISLANVPTSYSPFDWHTFTVSVEGSAIKVAVDGELLIDISNSDHAQGVIAILTSQAAVSADNVTVTAGVAQL